MSRARLGLYVFGRFDLFSGCHEIRNTLKTFMEKPLKLQLVQGERLPTQREVESDADSKNDLKVEDFQHLYKVVQEMLKHAS